MKKVFRFLGIIAILAVIGFSMAACGDDDGGGGSSAGSNGGGNGGSSPVPGRIPDNYLNTVWKKVNPYYPHDYETVTFTEYTNRFKYQNENGVWMINVLYDYTGGDRSHTVVSTDFLRLNIPGYEYSTATINGAITFLNDGSGFIFLTVGTYAGWKKQ